MKPIEPKVEKSYTLRSWEFWFLTGGTLVGTASVLHFIRLLTQKLLIDAGTGLQLAFEGLSFGLLFMSLFPFLSVVQRRRGGRPLSLSRALSGALTGAVVVVLLRMLFP